jgi:predicted dehydrogenase
MGVLSPSDIASRRFMPALAKVKGVEFAGIATADPTERIAREPVPESCLKVCDHIQTKSSVKADAFIRGYGGKLYTSYSALINDPEIDAVYIPLPPALHYSWGKGALNANKHVFMEKPFTVQLKDTVELLALAKKKGLTVTENYMFAYHAQVETLLDVVRQGTLGEIRIIRIDFGFPFRGADDFRYNKDLGGGALLDCGGYTLRLANILLDSNVRVMAVSLNTTEGFGVDVHGSVTLQSDDGKVAQIAFGMDNEYRCTLDIWGSRGSLLSDRILTAPVGFIPRATITVKGESEVIELPEDDSFMKSIENFILCIKDEEKRKKAYQDVFDQSRLVEEVRACLAQTQSPNEVSTWDRGIASGEGV